MQITINILGFIIGLIGMQLYFRYSEANQLKEQNKDLEATIIFLKSDIQDLEQENKSCKSILDSKESEFEKLWKNIEKDEVEGNGY